MYNGRDKVQQMLYSYKNTWTRSGSHNVSHKITKKVHQRRVQNVHLLSSVHVSYMEIM